MQRRTIGRLVAGARVARLATTDGDGRPNVVPFVFVLDGETVYSVVDRKPKASTSLRRLENIRERPDRIAVLVDHYEEDWSQLWWARLRGQGRIIEGGAEFDRALALLGEKYEQYRAAPPPGPVIAIDVTSWRGWSARPIE